MSRSRLARTSSQQTSRPAASGAIPSACRPTRPRARAGLSCLVLRGLGCRHSSPGISPPSTRASLPDSRAHPAAPLAPGRRCLGDPSWRPDRVRPAEAAARAAVAVSRSAVAVGAAAAVARYTGHPPASAPPRSALTGSVQRSAPAFSPLCGALTGWASCALRGRPSAGAARHRIGGRPSHLGRALARPRCECPAPEASRRPSPLGRDLPRPGRDRSPRPPPPATR